MHAALSWVTAPFLWKTGVRYLLLRLQSQSSFKLIELWQRNITHSIMLKWSYDLFYGCQPLTSPNTQLSWSARDKLSQIWLDAVLTSIRLQWESKASWLSIIRIAEEITNSRTALQIYDHSYNIWQKKNSHSWA